MVEVENKSSQFRKGQNVESFFFLFLTNIFFNQRIVIMIQVVCLFSELIWHKGLSINKERFLLISYLRPVYGDTEVVCEQSKAISNLRIAVEKVAVYKPLNKKNSMDKD